MFKKILVANRGEIALRIIRACREMGIRSVAVYSTADKDSLHVQMADESVCVGLPPSTDSYLNLPNILMAAKITGCEAIHPGYGYLSERESFAEACEGTGIVFIGPPPKAIGSVGDKAVARQIARSVGVSVLPGSDGPVDSEDEAYQLADELGYPVLIKAAAGGGGRGIRRVFARDELIPALRIAQNEAQSAFGSPSVYLEKYISDPRHIEVQLMADQHGNAIHLFERECSVQTPRHQKMIEEAPSPAVSSALRAQLGEGAVRLAKAVGYTNAGTVEFLMDGEGQVYFIEMNARLQVEHPVTELITGVDIVQTQLRVAAGEKLDVEQSQLKINGWAIEARLTSESPENDFAPSVGDVTQWIPPGGPGVRVDSHLYTGYSMPPFYDPLLAKIIVRAPDRQQAIARLERALHETRLTGFRTSREFLIRLITDPRFVAGQATTDFARSVLLPDDAVARR